jgi:hypothetical protein
MYVPTPCLRGGLEELRAVREGLAYQYALDTQSCFLVVISREMTDYAVWGANMATHLTLVPHKPGL